MRGLCLVTDRGLCADKALETVVRQAIQGGVTCVQLREKTFATRSFVEEAARLKALLSPLAIPLLINDRVDVALAVEADGVHLGQSDMPCELARRLLGPSAIIGLSVETWEDVVRAQDQPVDYLGVSPIFETRTKSDTRGSWGLEGLARIRAYSRHSLVAIGGLNAANITEVVQAGADCIAIVSAICSALDPELAAQTLNRVFLAAQAPGQALGQAPG